MVWNEDPEMTILDYDAVLHVTHAAVLLQIADGAFWFPLSKCPDLDCVSPGDGEGSFGCPEWLAEEKELI